MKDNKKTLIAYYLGSYGPTIRIEATTKEWLAYFKSEIIQLIEEKVSKIEITCLTDVTVEDIESVTLIKKHGEKNVVEKVSTINENHFIWVQDIDELTNIAGLVDGLLASDSPGHQYLTSEADDVLIILGYRELL